MDYFWSKSLGYLLTGEYTGGNSDELVLAAGFGGTIKTYDGDDHIILSSLDTKIETGSGDDSIYGGNVLLDVLDTSGNLEVYGASGSISVDKVQNGNLKLMSGAGSLSVLHYGDKGNVSTKSVSGSCTIDRFGMKGHIFVDTASVYTKIHRSYRNEDITHYSQTQGDIVLKGASCAVDICSNVSQGHILFEGVSSYNHIIREGYHNSKGDIHFIGAGGYNTIKHLGIGGNIFFQGAGIGNDIESKAHYGSIYFSGGGLKNKVNYAGQYGDIHFMGSGAENEVTHSGYRGDLLFEGMGAFNHVTSRAKYGDLTFIGNGAANWITRTGQQGDLKFIGAGFANVIEHDVSRGNMYVEALGAYNLIMHSGKGSYTAQLLSYGNISIHEGTGDSQVSMIGGLNTHTHIGHGDGMWRALGGANVMVQQGRGHLTSILAGGLNVLQKSGDGNLSVMALGLGNVITHLGSTEKKSSTNLLSFGGATVLTKSGKGDVKASLFGGLNVLTHVGDGNTTGMMIGGANIFTKIGRGNTIGLMFGAGNVMHHVGDGKTLGVMLGAGNIFTKLGDQSTTGILLGAGNFFTHVGHGKNFVVMAGLANVLTHVGDGELYALMLAQANIMTQVGDGETILVMAAQGNIATKVGDGDITAVMFGQMNILTHVGRGHDVSLMLGQSNVLTSVFVDESVALMLGQQQVFTHISDGKTIGLMGAQHQLMTKVGDGLTVGALLGQHNIMTHVGGGITGACIFGETNLITKVGDGLMAVVAAAQFNVITHVGDGMTVAALGGYYNALTKIGNGPTLGILASKVGNALTHIGHDTTLGITLGKFNIVTKVGDGDLIGLGWGDSNTFTQVGHGNHYQFAKGKLNIMTHVGDGRAVLAARGHTNVHTHIGDGDEYIGFSGDYNVATQVGNGEQTILTQGRLNAITHVGQGAQYAGIWGEASAVTQIGDGRQVVIAKGKAHSTTLVGDGLHVMLGYGDALVSTHIGHGTSVHVGCGKLNVHTKIGDGGMISVMKGKLNATVQIGHGTTVHINEGRQNVLLKVGHGDVYSLGVATSKGRARAQMISFLDDLKQTGLSILGGQAIHYLIQGQHPLDKPVQIDMDKQTQLNGFDVHKINTLNTNLTEVALPETHALDAPQQQSFNQDTEQNAAMLQDATQHQGSEAVLEHVAQNKEYAQDYRKILKNEKKEQLKKATQLSDSIEHTDQQKLTLDMQSVREKLEHEAQSIKQKIKEWTQELEQFGQWKPSLSQTTAVQSNILDDFSASLARDRQQAVITQVEHSTQKLEHVKQSMHKAQKTFHANLMTSITERDAATERKHTAIQNKDAALEKAHQEKRAGLERAQDARMEEQRAVGAVEVATSAQDQSINQAISEHSKEEHDVYNFVNQQKALRQRPLATHEAQDEIPLTSDDPESVGFNLEVSELDKKTSPQASHPDEHALDDVEEQLSNAVMMMQIRMNRLRHVTTLPDPQQKSALLPELTVDLPEPLAESADSSNTKSASISASSSVTVTGLNFEGLDDVISSNPLISKTSLIESMRAQGHIETPDITQVSHALHLYHLALNETDVLNEKTVKAWIELREAIQKCILIYPDIASSSTWIQLSEHMYKQQHIYLNQLDDLALKEMILQPFKYESLIEAMIQSSNSEASLIINPFNQLVFDTESYRATELIEDVRAARAKAVQYIQGVVAYAHDASALDIISQKAEIYPFLDDQIGMDAKQILEVHHQIIISQQSEQIHFILDALSLNASITTLEQLKQGLSQVYHPLAVCYLQDHISFLREHQDRSLTRQDMEGLQHFLYQNQPKIKRCIELSDSIYFTDGTTNYSEAQYKVIKELLKVPDALVDKLFNTQIKLSLYKRILGISPQLKIELQRNQGQGYRLPLDKNETQSMGCYDPEKNKIIIAMNLDASGNWNLPSEEQAATINPVLHELGHAADFILGEHLSTRCLSHQRDFLQAWQRQKSQSHLDDNYIHGFYGVSEMFAESFASLYARPTYIGSHDQQLHEAERVVDHHINLSFDALCLNPSKEVQLNETPKKNALTQVDKEGSFELIQDVYRHLDQDHPKQSSHNLKGYMATPGIQPISNMRLLHQDKDELMDIIISAIYVAERRHLFLENEAIEIKIKDQDLVKIATLYYQSTLEHQWKKRRELIQSIHDIGYSMTPNETETKPLAFWSGSMFFKAKRAELEETAGQSFTFDIDLPGISILHEINKAFATEAAHFYKESDQALKVEKYEMITNATLHNITYWSSFFATMARSDVHVIAPHLSVGNFFWNAELPILRSLQKSGQVKELRLIDRKSSLTLTQEDQALGVPLLEGPAQVRFEFYEGPRKKAILSKHPFLGERSTITVKNFKPNFLETALIKHKLFYTHRKERNVYALVKENQVILEPWPLQTDGAKKHIYFDHMLDVNQPEDIRLLRSIERFLLGSYQDYAAIPTALKVTSDQILDTSSTDAASKVLATKTKGIWSLASHISPLKVQHTMQQLEIMPEYQLMDHQALQSALHDFYAYFTQDTLNLEQAEAIILNLQNKINEQIRLQDYLGISDQAPYSQKLQDLSHQVKRYAHAYKAEIPNVRSKTLHSITEADQQALVLQPTYDLNKLLDELDRVILPAKSLAEQVELAQVQDLYRIEHPEHTQTYYALLTSEDQIKDYQDSGYLVQQENHLFRLHLTDETLAEPDKYIHFDASISSEQQTTWKQNVLEYFTSYQDIPQKIWMSPDRIWVIYPEQLQRKLAAVQDHGFWKLCREFELMAPETLPKPGTWSNKYAIEAYSTLKSLLTKQHQLMMQDEVPDVLITKHLKKLQDTLTLYMARFMPPPKELNLLKEQVHAYQKFYDHVTHDFQALGRDSPHIDFNIDELLDNAGLTAEDLNQNVAEPDIEFLDDTRPQESLHRPEPEHADLPTLEGSDVASFFEQQNQNATQQPAVLPEPQPGSSHQGQRPSGALTGLAPTPVQPRYSIPQSGSLHQGQRPSGVLTGLAPTLVQPQYSIPQSGSLHQGQRPSGVLTGVAPTLVQPQYSIPQSGSLHQGQRPSGALTGLAPTLVQPQYSIPQSGSLHQGQRPSGTSVEVVPDPVQPQHFEPNWYQDQSLTGREKIRINPYTQNIDLETNFQPEHPTLTQEENNQVLNNIRDMIKHQYKEYAVKIFGKILNQLNYADLSHDGYGLDLNGYRKIRRIISREEEALIRKIIGEIGFNTRASTLSGALKRLKVKRPMAYYYLYDHNLELFRNWNTNENLRFKHVYQLKKFFDQHKQGLLNYESIAQKIKFSINVTEDNALRHKVIHALRNVPKPLIRDLFRDTSLSIKIVKDSIYYEFSEPNQANIDLSQVSSMYSILKNEIVLAANYAYRPQQGLVTWDLIESHAQRNDVVYQLGHAIDILVGRTRQQNGLSTYALLSQDPDFIRAYEQDFHRLILNRYTEGDIVRARQITFAEVWSKVYGLNQERRFEVEKWPALEQYLRRVYPENYNPLGATSTHDHTKPVSTWKQVEVVASSLKHNSRFDSQIIIQTEDDPIAVKSAASLVGKHPQTSVLVQLDKKGQYRILHGDPKSISGRVRWQVVGHGQQDVAGSDTKMSSHTPEELATLLKRFSDDFNETHQVHSQAEYVSLVGCSLMNRDKKEGFAKQFMQALKAQGIRTQVAARVTAVGVNDQGRKGTKITENQWGVKQHQNKVVLKWNEQDAITVSQERIHNGVAVSDIDLSRVGKSASHKTLKGHISTIHPTHTIPKPKQHKTAPRKSKTSFRFDWSGNVDVVVGLGEYIGVKYGSSNVVLKCGAGGFKTLLAGDQNFAGHIGDGTSKYSVDLNGYQAFEGIQILVGHRNLVFNQGKSNDTILMLDGSIMPPVIVFPFDAAHLMTKSLNELANYDGESDSVITQDEQWNVAGAKKFAASFSSFDQTSSVAYNQLTHLGAKHSRSARGINYDLEATLNKQWNQVISGAAGSSEPMTRHQKLNELNQTLEANIAVGGQGADIIVTHGKFNFVFGDHVQSILDINLGSLFALTTQAYSASGQPCNTFTFKPSDLPRQLKNQLIGRLAQVHAEMTLADVFQVDYLASGQIVSRTQTAIDPMMMMRDLLAIFKEFGAEKLLSLIDTQALLDGLKAGIDMGEDGVRNFAQTHGLQSAPEQPVASQDTTQPTKHRPFGFESLNLPNIFAMLFHSEQREDMASKIKNLEANFTKDCLNMTDETLKFLRESGHLQGDGDLHVSSGNYNHNMGGYGNDVGIYLGDNNNFWGGRGDDVMYAMGTSNVFSGGAGQDQAVLMGRENWLFAGSGDDQAVLAGRHNYAYMGAGADQVFIFGEYGEIHTESGRDYAVITGRANRVFTEDDADYLVVIGHENQVDTGEGADYIRIFGESNTVQAGLGADHLKVSGFHSMIEAGVGDDMLIVDSMSKYNKIFGGDGQDTCMLGGYENIFYGGVGSDSFVVNDAVIQVEVADIQKDDLILFDGINWQDLWFIREDNDLKIILQRSKNPKSDQAQFESRGEVLYRDYFDDHRAHIVLHQDSDQDKHRMLTEHAVDQLVQAMSAVNLENCNHLSLQNLDIAQQQNVVAAWNDTRLV